MSQKEVMSGTALIGEGALGSHSDSFQYTMDEVEDLEAEEDVEPLRPNAQYSVNKRQALIRNGFKPYLLGVKK